MKIPRSCYGVKCMQKGCPNLASHKIGELNIWDRDDSKEAQEKSDMDTMHGLTTYLCDTHFNALMVREEVYFTKDVRFLNT